MYQKENVSLFHFKGFDHGQTLQLYLQLGLPGFACKGGAREKPGDAGGIPTGRIQTQKNPWISWQGWKILGSYPMILQEKFREIYKFSPWETVMVLKTELVQYHKLFHPTCLCKGTRNSGYMFLSLPLTWLFFHSKSNPLRSKCPQRTNKMAVP